jgi:hypothetical protein
MKLTAIFVLLSTLQLFFSSIVSAQLVNLPKIAAYQNNLPTDTLAKYNMPNAIILFELTDIHLNDIIKEREYLIYKRVRIKICNKKGFDAATISIPYYGVHYDEQLRDVYATTINNVNGKITTYRLDEKEIYTSEEDDSRKIAKFTFPSINDSSTLEYGYTIRRIPTFFSPIVLQNNYPTLKSYVLVENEKCKTSYTYTGIYPVSKKIGKFYGDAIDFSDEEAIDNNSRDVYTVSNIMPIPNEPFMNGSPIDYLTRISLKPESIKLPDGRKVKAPKETWDNTVKELLKSPRFGLATITPLNYDSLISSVPLITDTLQKIKRIYEYVRDSFKYTNSMMTYTYDIFNVLLKKEGSRGDLNLLLVNLLKGFGITAVPFLGRELALGRVDMENPSPYQFTFTGAIA